MLDVLQHLFAACPALGIGRGEGIQEYDKRD
jgi:hypothetical protein